MEANKPSGQATVERVSHEVERAYRDCHTDDFEAAMKVRSLDFKASAVVSREEAKTILQASIPLGYNEFKPELLDLLPGDSQILIAREGSVCLYVRTNQKIDNTYLHEDEFDVVEPNVTRIWWD